MTLIWRAAVDLVDEVVEADAVVVGTGVAGLTAALGLAPRHVVVLTKTRIASGSSTWAQGGIASAMAKDDSPGLHAADTMAAGDGLADPEVVEHLTSDGPFRVSQLIALGAQFDRAPDGALRMGREGAHSRRRILHAGGDATGTEMVRALIETVQHEPAIEVSEHTFASDLALDGGRVVGVLAERDDGRPVLFLAPAVVLATGGLGNSYLHTTNPPEATGDGHAMAARAGARLVDMEFVQFHPTALNVAKGRMGDPQALAGTAHAPDGPMPLLTEALRGEGAVLVNGAGYRFMVDEHPLAELAPRDVVARAIWRRQAEGQAIYLDARDAVGDRFPSRFPTVFAACRKYGIDPRHELMPVSPAAHYHMGGIAVDSRGRSSLPGLWACGEAASTGVHGANRLASNSLLEALVFGAWVAEDIRSATPQISCRAESALVPSTGPTPSSNGQGAPLAAANRTDALHAGDNRAAERDVIDAVRRLMWEQVGLVRDAAGLTAALAALEGLAAEAPHASGEARNLLLVARLIATTALARTESRGAHYRSDFPAPDARWQRRLFLTASFRSGRLSVEIAASDPVLITALTSREAA